jgi:hypothetical protein
LGALLLLLLLLLLLGILSRHGIEGDMIETSGKRIEIVDDLSESPRRSQSPEFLSPVVEIVESIDVEAASRELVHAIEYAIEGFLGNKGQLQKIGIQNSGPTMALISSLIAVRRSLSSASITSSLRTKIRACCDLKAPSISSRSAVVKEAICSEREREKGSVVTSESSGRNSRYG